MLSPIATPLCSEPQPVPAAVTGYVEGKQITVCPSSVSSPEYFPLHNDGGLASAFSILFPSQLSQLHH